MIDIHSHVWEEKHYSEAAKRQYRETYGDAADFDCTPEAHWDSSGVAGGPGRRLRHDDGPRGAGGAQRLRARLRQPPPPTSWSASPASIRTIPACCEQLRHAVRNLGFRALKLSGAYQNFDPSDVAYDELYRTALRLDIPIFWHQSTNFFAETPLRWSKPVHLDQVAQRFPKLRMVICHIGHPWYTDAVMVARKHRNVYCDMSGYGFRRWRFYVSLVTAVEYDIGDKVLFGTDYPFCSVEDSIAYLRDAVDFGPAHRAARDPGELRRRRAGPGLARPAGDGLMAGGDDPVGAGEHRYRPDPEWGALPAGWSYVEVAGVATDSQDNVYVFNRGEHPVVVFDRDGTFLRSWGRGNDRARPRHLHHRRRPPVPDRRQGPHRHRVHAGRRSGDDDGRRAAARPTPAWSAWTTAPSRGRQGRSTCRPTWSRPAAIAFTSPTATATRGCTRSRRPATTCSPGAPLGSGPGEFHLPHGIDVDSRGRVFVADRENSRLQLFDAEGGFLEEWRDVARATDLFI